MWNSVLDEVIVEFSLNEMIVWFSFGDTSAVTSG